MTAEDRIKEFKSDIKGEGLCAVCHQDRRVNGCWSSWTVELSNGKWDGRVNLWCKSFPRDRAQLAEALNKYHVRETVDVQDAGTG